MYGFCLVLLAEPEPNRRRNGRGGVTKTSTRGRGAGGRGGRRNSPAPVAQQSTPSTTESQQNATTNHVNSESSSVATNGKSEITSNGDAGSSGSTNGGATQKSEDCSSSNQVWKFSLNHDINNIHRLIKVGHYIIVPSINIIWCSWSASSAKLTYVPNHWLKYSIFKFSLNVTLQFPMLWTARRVRKIGIY